MNQKPTFWIAMALAGIVHTSGAQAVRLGESAPLDALAKAQIIQGEAPQAWEPGKLYFLECWATWCGPCVAAIPHLDAMYDKYKDQGLRVIGINVREGEKNTVAEFVKKKGERMSYPVLFDGKAGSAFDGDWMKPNEINGIPATFVVKDGKLLFIVHPSQLTEERIKILLAGGEKANTLTSQMSAATVNEATVGQKVDKLMAAFMEAKKTDNFEKMLQTATEIDRLGVCMPGSGTSPYDVLVKMKDWTALEKRVSESKSSRAIVVGCASALMDAKAKAPESLNRLVLSELLKVHELNPTGHPGADALGWEEVAYFQRQLGDNKAAEASTLKAKNLMRQAEKEAGE